MKLVPLSGGRLTTDEKGNLYLNHSKLGSIDDVVKVDWVLGERDYNVLDLVGFSMIPIYVPTALWEGVEVKKCGGDNLYQSLRYWFKSPILAFVLGDEEFYYVADFTKYAISKKQNLASVHDKKIITPYAEKDGYRHYSLLGDCGRRKRLSRHRAMLLAFTDRPIDYRRLDINHINCIPGDDDLSNLEWSTRKENMDHAVDCGRVVNAVRVIVRVKDDVVEYPSITRAAKALKVCRSKFVASVTDEWTTLKEGITFKFPDPGIDVHRTAPVSKPVYLKYIRTGEVVELPSIVSVAEVLHVPLATMRKRLRRGTEYYYDGDVKVSHTDKWLDVCKYHGDGLRPVLVKDYNTGEVTKYPSVVRCAEILGLHKDTVLYRMYELRLKLCPGNLMFQSAENSLPWPKIDNLVTAALEFGIRKPLLVRDVFTGEVVEYPSATDFANRIGVDQGFISTWLSKYGQRIFRKKYQLKYKQDQSQWSVPDDLEQAIEDSTPTRSVLIRNHSTGVVKEYSSAVECAKDLKILPTTLNWRLKSNGLKIYSDGLQYKYKSDPTPWLT